MKTPNAFQSVPRSAFIALAAFALLVVVGIAMRFVPSSSPQEKTRSPQLGEEGAVCGGKLTLPCKPGLVCDKKGHGSDANEEGLCIKDARPQVLFKKEGEACDQAKITSEQCGWGLTCVAVSGTTRGTCQPMLPTDKPFVMAVIPEGMQLVDGSYRAKAGTEVTVHVRAVRVTGGALYLKPMTSSYSGVVPQEKVADLKPSGIPNEYAGVFTMSKPIVPASLTAVMKGEDGQDITLGVNVLAE